MNTKWEPNRRRPSALSAAFIMVVLMACPVATAQGIFPDKNENAEATVEETAPRADLVEAKGLVKEGKYAEAIEVLHGLRPDYPEDPSLLLLLGELLIATRNSNDAIEPLQKAAGLAPEKERINFQLGSALTENGRSDEALKAFAAELEIASNTEIITYSRLNRSLLLQQAGRWTDAAAEMEKLLEVQPDKKEIYGDLSAMYIQAGDLATAGDALKRGEEHGFVSAPHYYSLGARYYREGRFRDAVTALGRALEISPDTPEAERSLAASLDKLGRSAEAIPHLRKYLELRPDAPDRDKIMQQIENASQAE